MRKTTIAALAAATVLCACGPRPETGCMSPGEIGTIETVKRYKEDGSYSNARDMVMIRFRMRRFQQARGGIRICKAAENEAHALLKVGDTLNPRDMDDATP